jgi:hypothetical protein
LASKKRFATSFFFFDKQDALFPAGTWAMVRLFGCRCAAAG